MSRVLANASKSMNPIKSNQSPLGNVAKELSPKPQVGMNRNNLFLSFIFGLVLICNLHADWVYSDEETLTHYSEIIVVASLQQVIEERIDPRFAPFNPDKHQVVEFRSIEFIKGNLSETFLVRGYYTAMCAPFRYFPNQKDALYLLFLKPDPKKKDLYTVAAGYAAFPVIEGLVFIPEGSPEKETLLSATDRIKTYIKSHIATKSE